MALTNKQLRAIHAKKKGYSSVVMIIGKAKTKDRLIVGTPVRGTATKKEAFVESIKQGNKLIEKKNFAKGTVRISTAIKNSELGSFDKRTKNPIVIGVITTTPSSKIINERIVAKRGASKDSKLQFNPKLRKTARGREFIREAKKKPF